MDEHRVSVSMPSLDAADDFPSESTTDAVFAAALDNGGGSLVPRDVEEAENEENPFLNSEILTEKSLKDDLEENLEENKAEEAGETSEALIDTSAEGLDESQGDEDPSIAIDQFIKKIADEQLSSKRIEEREEEEEEKEEPMPLDENPPIEEEEEQEDKQEESIKSTDTDDAMEKSMEPELMETDEAEAKAEAEEKTLEKVVAEAVGDSDDEDDDDEHMAESIEEIQKEINKIPVKKLIGKAKSEKEDNGICEMDEDIEEILGGVSADSENSAGNILKIALEKEHKLPTAKDLADITKNPELIEQAKEELSKMDLMVCGDCHTTFYFYHELMEHKKTRCPKFSTAIPTDEIIKGGSQQQIWGYLLWKSKVLDLNDNRKFKWSLYQSWCNLPQSERNSWISAGISIQFGSKMLNSKVVQMRPARMAKQSFVQKIANAPPPLEFIDSNKENSSIFSIDSSGNIVKKGLTPARPVKMNDVRIAPKIAPASSSDLNSAMRSGKVGTKKEEFVVEKIMAKRFNPRRKTWEYNIKWENFGHESNTWEPMNNLSHCKKLLEQFEEQLKRMKEEKAKNAISPKSRGRPTKDNKINNSFGSPKITNIVGGVADDYGSPSGTNRPQRHCKQKALNQVKQWCDNNSEEDEETGVKRKFSMDEDDSDDEFEDKRIKLENEGEDSDTETPMKKATTQIKKVVSTPRPIAPAKLMKNGTKTQQQIVPSNILIPDARGVVRINQKQLPSLKSGVYIMSKTAGIIKLDSNSSKMATSGKQTVVTVSPKVGEATIKVVSKDGKTTREIVSQQPSVATPAPVKATIKAVTPRSTSKIRQENKKTATPNQQASKTVLKKVEETSTVNKKSTNVDEDSDDGLEPLPFPAPDEPIPPIEEEEKTDDFVLDPETGKIAGIEYVDKPVVIKKEPQPTNQNAELENIVKIAAADLSDDDFEGGNDSDDSMLQIKEETPIKTTPKSDPMERTMVDTSTRGIRKIIKYTVSGPSATPTILNKNVAQSQAKPKPIIRPQAQGVRPPQKVINQIVSQPRASQSPQMKTLIRQQQQQANESPRTVVRKMATPPGGGGPINSRMRGGLVSKPLPSPLQPTRTYSTVGGVRPANRVPAEGNKVAGSPAVVRRAGAGNAIIRASPSGNVVRQQTPQNQQTVAQQRQQQQVTRIVQRAVSPQKKPAVKQVQNKPMTTPPVKTKTVINMPSLMEEDSPLSPPAKLQQAKPAAQQRPLAAKPATPAVSQASKPVAAPKQPPALTPLVKQELKNEETKEEAETQQQAEAAVVAPAAVATEQQEDWSSFTMNDGENPIYVTGDDGTLYQVAGQNEEGQTILLTEGPDGQQQCLLVSNEIGEMIGEEEPQPGTSGVNVVAEADEAMDEVLTIGQGLQVAIKPDAVEAMNDQVVATVVQAEPLSPGGTHKVVVMLPDGTFMLTKVTPEEYAKLEIGT